MIKTIQDILWQYKPENVYIVSCKNTTFCDNINPKMYTLYPVRILHSKIDLE